MKENPYIIKTVPYLVRCTTNLPALSGVANGNYSRIDIPIGTKLWACMIGDDGDDGILIWDSEKSIHFSLKTNLSVAFKILHTNNMWKDSLKNYNKINGHIKEIKIRNA